MKAECLKGIVHKAEGTSYFFFVDFFFIPRGGNFLKKLMQIEFLYCFLVFVWCREEATKLARRLNWRTLFLRK